MKLSLVKLRKKNLSFDYNYITWTYKFCIFSFLLFCVLFVCVLYLVYSILPVSLECSSLIAPSVYSNVYLFCLPSFCVLCTQCYQFLWNVHSWLPLRFSLTFICFVCLRPVSCVPKVASFPGSSILDCPFGFF